VSSFAQVRALSTAIVVGVASRPVADSVQSGPLAGAPLRKTSFTVTKVLWGKVEGTTITISQLMAAGAEMRAVARDQAVTAVAVLEDDEVLAAQAHRLDRPVDGELVDQLPPTMPADSAEQATVS